MREVEPIEGPLHKKSSVSGCISYDQTAQFTGTEQKEGVNVRRADPRDVLPVGMDEVLRGRCHAKRKEE